MENTMTSPKKVTLYSIANKMTDLAMAIETDPESGETFGWDEFLEAEGEFERKAEALAVAIQFKNGIIETQRTLIKNLQARIKAEESDVENMKNYLKENMERVDIKRIDTVATRITLRDSEAVNILDESLIPVEYKKVKYEVSKTAIKDAIKAGVSVPGAEIQKNRSVTIK